MNPEIIEWLKRNEKTLMDRAPHEIAHLAVTCGFKVDDVCEALSHWKIDIQTRTTQNFRVGCFGEGLR